MDDPRLSHTQVKSTVKIDYYSTMSTAAPEYGASVIEVSKPSGKMAHATILAFGQGLSILLAVALGAQSKMYLDCDWSSPAFSCGCAFVLISLHMIPLYVRGRAIRKGLDTTAPTHWFCGVIPLHGSPLVYACLSLLSFYGNYFSLMALRYTTITSTSLFDAMSIPTAMILSSLFLGRKYKMTHLLGATVCLIGILLNAGVDIKSNHNTASSTTGHDDGSQEYPHKIFGDLMACLGGILFGANDMLAEKMVRRNGGSTEYLAMVGFFAMCFSMLHASITERESIAKLFNGDTLCSGNKASLLFVFYVLAQFSRKAGLAKFLTVSEAALLQLSLLTSDIFVAVFSIVFEQIFPRNLFWVAMTLVLIGISVYECGPSPIIIVEEGDIELDGVMKKELDATIKSESAPETA